MPLLEYREAPDHVLCGHILPVSPESTNQASVVVSPTHVVPVVLFTIQGFVGGHVCFHGGSVVSLLTLHGGGVKLQARVSSWSLGCPKVTHLFTHHLSDNSVTLRLCARVRGVTKLAAAWPSTGHHAFLLFAPVHPHG